MASPEVEKLRHDAIVKRSTDAVAALIHDRWGTETTDWGSGTLLRRGPACVVLTARHVVEGRDRMQLMVEGYEYPVADAVERVVLGPGRTDVALAILRSPVALSVANMSLPADVLAEPEELASLPGENPLLVVGFSRQLKGETRRRGRREIHMKVMARWGSDVGQDDRAFSIEWRRGVAVNTLSFGDVEIPAGSQIPLKKPRGLSGGAVFGLRRLSTASPWHVDHALRFVGVPHEFSNGRQQAVKITCFREWLLEQLACA